MAKIFADQRSKIYSNFDNKLMIGWPLQPGMHF